MPGPRKVADHDYSTVFLVVNGEDSGVGDGVNIGTGSS